MDYVPAGGGNGKILEGQILGSLDGETFTEITTVNWANNETIKTIDFEESHELQYIKIVGKRTSTAGGGSFIAGRMFNFYQDTTHNPHPTAGIGYSTTEITNKNVVARLINPSTNIQITNNDGNDSYTFTKNGTFTFEFIDEVTKEKGSAIAKVDWIDKTPPTADVEYSTTSPTKNEVEAKLVNISEEVEILNNGGEEEPNKLTYVFQENGTFTFRFRDRAGNIGTATAKVDWIRETSTMPKATITYSTTKPTNKNVVATIKFDEDNIKIINNNNKNTYTFRENGTFVFRYQNEVGDIDEAIAKVTNIDKVPPTASIKYNITYITNKKVIATLTNASEKITILNNSGKKDYTFTKNGNFAFKFQDAAGNTGTAIAQVSWITSSNNSNPNNPINPSNPVNPSNPDKPNNNQPTLPNQEEYNVYQSDETTIIIPKSSGLLAGLTPRRTKLSLNKNLEKEIGTNYDYFNLYLETPTNEKQEIPEMPITIRLKLDPSKILTAVYQISNNNEITKLEYSNVGYEQIEITTNKLEGYILSYREKETNKNTNNKLIYTFFTLCVLAFSGSLYYYIIKYRKIKRKSK